MAYNIIPQRGVFSTIANLINENFQRIYQQILGLDGSGEQAAEDISQLESDVSALQSGKANDADVVHKAGAETITGNKTFTGTVVLTLQNSGILVIDENGVVKSDSIVIVNDVTYEAGDNIFYLKKTVNGTKSNIVQVEVTPNSNSTGLVTSGGIYTALAHKVDKVQSTDNAVVRFDGASGAVQNSGVTINDSNHLTAAKFITSGGTSSQVVLGNGTLIAADILPQYEAYLKWGGKSISNGYSPIDASMIGELGANRLAFPNAGGITVEYSRDSGTTWTDYQASDDKKVGLFSGIQQNFAIGKAASNDVASNTYQLRIKIVAGSGSSAVGVYTQLNKFAFLASTSGSTGCWCTIKGRKTEDYNDNTETYNTYADQVAIGGWSGYNIINTSSITFGSGNAQIKEITFTFGCGGYNGNGTTHTGLQIYKVFCFGGVGWTEPSNMARHDHLYYWDSIQNMITPAGVYPKISSTYNLGSTSFFWKEVYANKFVTKNGTSSQFVKGDGTLDSTSYAPLASPALTGTPTAPTATAGTNTTQIATTAFVKSAADDLSETLTDGAAASESGNVIDIGNYDLMKINEVKGKSLVMNQLGGDVTKNKTGNSFTKNGVTVTWQGQGQIKVEGEASATGTIYDWRIRYTFLSGHIYVYKIVTSGVVPNSLSATNASLPIYDYFTRKPFGANQDPYWGVPVIKDVVYDGTIKILIYDLTKMFGAGNEPTTVEEVEAILGNDCSECNTGEVVGNNVGKLDVYDSNDTKKGSLALNLTELTGEAGERLPAGYTKLEYIESSGTQYINTGISPTVNTGVEIKAVLTTENTTDKVLFGSRATTGNTRYWIDFDNSGSKHKIMYGFGPYVEMVVYSLNTEYSIVFNKNGDKKVVINGTTYNMTYTFDATDSIPIYLFRANYTSPIPGSFKVYYCRIYEGTSLVRNLIPAKRNSDNVIGMYDKVSGTFLTNAGTGEFIAGSVVQSVTIFPDGLHGVGDVFDSLIVDEDGYARRAVKRMAKVDIGTFTWNTTSTESRFYASLPADATAYTAINNVFKNTYSCDKYTKSTTLTGMADKTTFLGNTSYIYAQDSSYTTAADFKTAMSGVMLYYELATPIEYVLDTPVQCVVPVSKNGIVKQVPVMPDSTPMIMDVTYLHDTGGVIGGLVNKLASLEPRIDDLAKGIKTISVQYGDTTNIILETEKINGNEGTVSIPAATSQAAGAMSAAQAALLEDLSDLADDIETLLASI